MPDESFRPLAEKILHYTQTEYDLEYHDDHKYSVPQRLSTFEEKVAGSEEDDPWYDVEIESIHESIDRLDDNDLFTSSTFLGHLLNPPVDNLRIPDYQRDYSWDRPNNLRYWVDLMTLFEKVSQFDGQNDREQYFGSAYVSDESDHLEVIDGQQRVTTSLILLLTIHRHLTLLQDEVREDPDVNEEFRDFYDYFVGDEFLEEMLYPSSGQPVLVPNESDEHYFNIIFAKQFRKIQRHLGNIETGNGPGGVIGVSKLLEKGLGLPPHKLDELDSPNKNENLVQYKSNRLLRESYNFFRTRVGGFVDFYEGMPHKKEFSGSPTLNVDVMEVTGSEVIFRASSEHWSSDKSENIPVGNVNVYQLNEGDSEISDESYIGKTSAVGITKIELDSLSDGTTTFVFSSRGEQEKISFDSVDELRPNPISVVSDEDKSILELYIRDDGDTVQNTTVQLNNTEAQTNENGLVTFEIDQVSSNSSDDEPNYIVTAAGNTREFDEIEGIPSEYTVVDVGQINSPDEKGRVLINLVFVLLHSLRIVYSEFGIPNKQYKIDIFQSLNDRGEDLDTPDLIRARIIARGLSNVDDWTTITKRFNNEPSKIVDFLKQYLTAEQGITKPDERDVKSLFSLYEATVGDAESIINTDSNSSAESALSELESYSKRYREIKTASIPADSQDVLNGFTAGAAGQALSDEEKQLKSECEILFEHLNEVGTVWEPLVLALYYKFSNTEGQGEGFNNILKVINKVLYRYTAFGEGISSTINRTYMHNMTKKYRSDIDTIQDPNAVIDLLQKNLPEELEIGEVSRKYCEKRNWQSDTLKSILSRHTDIKLSERSGSSQYLNSQFTRDHDAYLTIEHTFPHNLGLNPKNTDPKAWLEEYFESVDSGDAVQNLIDDIDDSEENVSEDDLKTLRERFVNDIGNTMLLVHAENASVSDRLYSKKITYYFLVGINELMATNDEHYTENQLEDVVKLIEFFSEKAGYDESVTADLLGLLMRDGDTAHKTLICDSLDNSDINPSDLETKKIGDKVSDGDELILSKARDMLSKDVLDETDSTTAPNIVKKFNSEWTIKKMKSRKTSLVRDILETLVFNEDYDEEKGDKENFGADLDSLIDEDYERRIGLR